MVHYTSNRHGSARRVNDQATDWEWHRGTYLFLRSDYDQIEAEYLDKKRLDLPEEQILQWWQEKKSRTMKHMEEVVKISNWRAKFRWQQEGSNSLDRSQFFRAKAAALDPPMFQEELECMAAYHKALRSTNPPSDLAWQILLQKITPHRDVAAKVLEVQREMADSYGNWNNPPRSILRDRELREHRNHRNRGLKISATEQDFVVELGRREFERCLENGVSDTNLVLACFKNVFEAYEQLSDRPEGFCHDGSRGTYTLSMDDARMIVEEVIEPDMPTGSQRRSRVLNSFKCPGCRTDYQREMGFVECLLHVYHKHAKQVGDDGEFWRLLRPFDSPYRGFPFYSTPWMRCLPILPSYCDARVMRPWHPDSEMDFLQEEVGHSDSAFEGRAATWPGEEQPTFLEAFAYAMNSMQGVTLKPQFVLKVALRYACGLSAKFDLEIPTLADFIETITPIQKANPTLRLKFRCETCVKDEGELARARPVKFEVAVEQLYQHWNSKHSGQDLEWTQDFMRLPSDAELLEEMLKNDEKLRKDKAKITGFVQEEQAKKRPNPKASVILGMSFATDVFDELYHKMG